MRFRLNGSVLLRHCKQKKQKTNTNTATDVIQTDNPTVIISSTKNTGFKSSMTVLLGVCVNDKVKATNIRKLGFSKGNTGAKRKKKKIYREKVGEGECKSK